MKDAAALVQEGAPHGSLVVADEQTAGIGRHGHSWHSGPDGGLYMSMVLRVANPGPALTMALGLAVQQAVDAVAEVATDLRWPNDVLLNERKLAGIMVQNAGEALIAGIGVNVNQAVFPEDLRAIATSLRVETGREYEKEILLERVVKECLGHVHLTTAQILAQFERHSSYVRGKQVVVDGRIEGVTAGLDENGFLLLRTDAGTETIVTGGVRPR